MRILPVTSGYNGGRRNVSIARYCTSGAQASGLAKLAIDVTREGRWRHFAARNAAGPAQFLLELLITVRPVPACA
jgi:hypothetical protein